LSLSIGEVSKIRLAGDGKLKSKINHSLCKLSFTSNQRLSGGLISKDTRKPLFLPMETRDFREFAKYLIKRAT